MTNPLRFIIAGAFMVLNLAHASDPPPWIPQNSVTTAWLQDVLFVNGNFIAVGTTQNDFPYHTVIFVSSDGVNWSERYVSPQGILITKLAYANGIFVGGGTRQGNSTTGTIGILSTSPDLVNWTQVYSATPNSTSIKPFFENNLWLAVVSTGLGGPNSNDEVLSSSDAVGWTRHPTGTHSEIGTVFFGNGLYVAAGNVILTSPDLTSWTERVGKNFNGGFYMRDGLYQKGVFVAAGSGGVLSSSDGVNWVSLLASAYRLDAITYGNGLFMAVGTPFSAESQDGLTWTTRDIGLDSQHAVAGGNSMFVAVGGIRNRILPPAQLFFTQPTYQVLENAGSATIPVSLYRESFADPNTTVTVDYAISPGTATAGVDFSSVSGTLTFLPGETNKSFSIPILTDSVEDDGKTVNLRLTNPAGSARLGSQNTALLTIVDRTIFSLGAPDINEDQAFAKITVQRSGIVERLSTVTYFTVDGFDPLLWDIFPFYHAARAGADYDFRAGALVFNPGETTKSIEVPILDNGAVDGDRAFTVRLAGPTNILAEASIIIHDNEISSQGPDLSFHPSPPFPDYGVSGISTLALDSEGRILIGGAFDTAVLDLFNFGTRQIARLFPDGSLDRSFSAAIDGADSVGITTIIPQSDGMLIGGDFLMIDGLPHAGIARLNLNGSADPNFNAQIALINQLQLPSGPAVPQVMTIATQKNGMILIGGIFDRVNGLPRTNLARLHSDGSLDLTFTAGAGQTHLEDPFNPLSVSASMVAAIAVQPSDVNSIDENLVIGGKFTSINGEPRSSLARLKPDGSLDSTFLARDGVKNYFGPGLVRTMALQPNGFLIIAGQFNSVERIPRNGLAQLGLDGYVTGAFASGINFNNVFLNAPQTGEIYLAHISCIEEGCRYFLQRFLSDGSVDETFTPISGNGRIVAMAQQGDGQLLLAGLFYANGLRGSLLRLLADPNRTRVQLAGDPYDPFNLFVPENAGPLNLTVQRLGPSAGRITVDYFTLDETARAGIDYLATSGTLEFKPLETVKRISIPLLHDPQISPDPLNFQIRLANATQEIGLDHLTIWIADTDPRFLPAALHFSPAGEFILRIDQLPIPITYVLEGSANLVNWIPLTTNLYPQTIELIDIDAPKFPSRFYRLKQIPP